MIKINQTLNYRKAPIASGSVVIFDFEIIQLRNKTNEGVNVKSWICTMQMQWYVSEGIEADYSNRPLGKPDEFPSLNISKELNEAEFAAAFVNPINTKELVETWVADAIGGFEGINESNIEIL